MPEKYTYKTIQEHSEHEIEKIKGSKFIGNIFPITTKEEYKNAIEQIQTKYHDATHSICHAVTYGINVNFNLFGEFDITWKYTRADDNGEPANTAGKPILSIIQGENIHNVLITVTRYFGGTLLGIGGLIQAYSQCARATLEHANIIEKEILSSKELVYDYDQTSQIMHLISKYEGNIIDQTCEHQAKIHFEINKGYETDFDNEIKNILY